MFKSPHPLLETHGRYIAAYASVFLMTAAQCIIIEVAVSERFLKSRALHLVHVDWTHS